MQSLDLLDRSYPGARSESKRQILKCALALFNEHGMESTTIDLIRIHSQSSVGSIYHHFGNKEGVIAALYRSALDDQSKLRTDYLQDAKNLREGIFALVFSYVDWVVANPDWARFIFKARFYLVSSSHGEELTKANASRNAKLKEWLEKHAGSEGLRAYPFELIPSLLIGASENYCRAWLSGRVKQSPEVYRQQLAQAAWLSVEG